MPCDAAFLYKLEPARVCVTTLATCPRLRGFLSHSNYRYRQGVPPSVPVSVTSTNSTASISVFIRKVRKGAGSSVTYSCSAWAVFGRRSSGRHAHKRCGTPCSHVSSELRAHMFGSDPLSEPLLAARHPLASRPQGGLLTLPAHFGRVCAAPPHRGRGSCGRLRRGNHLGDSWRRLTCGP